MPWPFFRKPKESETALDRAISSFPIDVREAHRHCSGHRSEILASRSCGCFYCLSIFSPEQIAIWIDWPDDDDEREGQTALCPECGIDSVIGDRSGFPITRTFFGQMRECWF